MPTLAHAYQYAFPSAISDTGRPHLTLATSNAAERPHFFEGRLLQPRLCADLLTAVHLIVGSRFFLPANSLAKVLALADPVVTSGGGILRFEGFSGCCSTYIRADMLPAAYDGETIGQGTTNVDFNAPMRAALARLRDADGLDLSVGAQEVTLRSGGHSVTEKKVELPLRWLRGMLEVQSYLAGMRVRHTMSGMEALRFLRALPRNANGRTPLWMVAGPGGLRMTAAAAPNGVRISDTSRLRVLEQMAPKAKSVAVYADDAQQSCAWVLDFGTARLTLALSAETWRGFSGEGQALRALLRASGSNSLVNVRAQLAWQPVLDADAIAGKLALPAADVDDALRVLGASGLVGFDVLEGRYFHRVLPFDLTLVEDLNPRLAGARELLEQDAVRIVRERPFEAIVASGGTEHRVREVGEELHCTCPWFAKYQGARGPCKHVLASEAMR
ncbi:SWIM zinc finger family protein [Pseudoduganella violaceinigra]|uniref:SWIM zinc finger family protein n=1 Tax=Pseudoduganella violaceinigra TaxID=246602 RepID=UPI000488EB00|nr:SWIM zinc finger family protein [Pseudoduganella violaceinigra]